MFPGDAPPVFGRFQLLQVMRQDGEETLHQALDLELGHKVMLITGPAGAGTAGEGMLARRLRKLRHPNIVSVLEMGQERDTAFLAAECLETEPLSRMLARAGRLPVFQGLALVLQLLSAIEHAHERRLVHATVDLEHVQVTPGGRPMLPAAGWSLSSERQPNLEAAARMAQVLLAGTCPPRMRHALDEVVAGRYASADAFAQALLAASGAPVWNRKFVPAIRVQAPLPAEPQRPPAAPATERPRDVLLTERGETPFLPPPAMKPSHWRVIRQGLVAACIAAALLVSVPLERSSLNPAADPRAAKVPVAMAPAPEPVAPAPQPAAPPKPAAPQKAVMPVVAPPVVAPPIAPAPVAAPPVAAPPVAPRAAEPAVVAKVAVAPKPAQRVAKKKVTRTRPAPTVRVARAAPVQKARVRTARPQAARAVSSAFGCAHTLQIASDLCVVRECRRPEYRSHPVCVGLRVEQRAALARLRGTPD